MQLRERLFVTLGNRDEISRLRQVLVDRYADDMKGVINLTTFSTFLLSRIKKDPEAYLYCLMYEKRVRLKKSRLFPVMFEYPKLVSTLCKYKHRPRFKTEKGI